MDTTNGAENECVCIVLSDDLNMHLRILTLEKKKYIKRSNPASLNLPKNIDLSRKRVSKLYRVIVEINSNQIVTINFACNLITTTYLLHSIHWVLIQNATCPRPLLIIY